MASHKSVGQKLPSMVKVVPRSVGVSWSSGSYPIKSTEEDKPVGGRQAEGESRRHKGSPLTESQSSYQISYSLLNLAIHNLIHVEHVICLT